MEIHHRIEINERFPVLRSNFAQNGYKVFFSVCAVKRIPEKLKDHCERGVFFKSGFVFKNQQACQLQRRSRNFSFPFSIADKTRKCSTPFSLIYVSSLIHYFNFS